jgi:hypothetical protein
LRPATRARIEAAHGFSPLYRGYLANHLPMALLALDAMGVADADIERFATRYVAAHLEPLEAHPGLARRIDEFRANLAREGAGALLARHADGLATGIASGAFHGAIRTAYAVESGIESELAHALAYWTVEFDAAPAPALPGGTSGPLEILASLSRDPRFAMRRFPGRNIVERTRAAMADPAFSGLAARLDPAALTLRELAGAMIRAYAASGDFTLLHAVTGTHALRVLLPYVKSPSLALAHHWQALLAAYLGAGSPPVEGWALAGDDTLAWARVHELAARCDDEHDVKLAYSCWREATHYGDDLYRRAASSRVCHALRESMAC